MRQDKSYLGTSPVDRKLRTLTPWQGNEYLTSGSTEIMAWKWFSNVERCWCLHPFYRQYFLGRKLFHSSHSQPFARPSFLRVCLQSITHRSWYNLYFFGSFHLLKGLSFSLLSVLIMFVNETILDHFVNEDVLIHFTSSSPGTPCSSFNTSLDLFTFSNF